MRTPETPPLSLSALRVALDALDDGLLVVAALRGSLAAEAGRIKRRHALPLRNPEREHAVQRRARRLARRLPLSEPAADALMRVLIDEACRRQGLGTNADRSGTADPDQGEGRAGRRTLQFLRQPPAHPPRMNPPANEALLRLLPPPRRWSPLLRWLPPAALAQAFQHAARRVLGAALARGELAALDGRVLGIEVLDLGLRYRVRVQGSALQIDALPAQVEAEARVAGSLTDLLLLASRLEDADTLFFQRRLSVSGDTELGLLARNLLDQLDWSQVPLPLRIVLNRAARFAERARAVHARRPSRGS